MLFSKDFLFLLFCYIGISFASSEHRKRHIKRLKETITQPLSKCSEKNIEINKEEFYVDLTLVDSSDIEEEHSNSDRTFLIENKFKKRKNIRLNEIIKQDDKAVFIRGVGGTGKTTLLEMYTLRWAKKSLEGI